MKNYPQSPRQKTFTPPSVQPAANVQRQKVEFYSGARFDTFLPSASALPMPPVQWIDSNASRSQSTPTSPIPKTSISATKSIDIAAVFGSIPFNNTQQKQMTPTTVNNRSSNGPNKQVLKSNSYPGEKVLRTKFEQPQQQQNNNKVAGKNDYKGKQRNQGQVVNRKRENQQHQKDFKNVKPTAATSKTLISTAAPTTTVIATNISGKPEKTFTIPAPQNSTSLTISGNEIGLNLMTMLGVTPTKVPPKIEKIEEKKTPVIEDYSFLARQGSPQKYQEITQNLKLLLKVQA